MCTSRSQVFLSLLMCLTVTGCSELLQPPGDTQPRELKEKGTDDIGKFDPKAGKEVVSDDVKVSDPLFYALQAYGPIKQQIAGIATDHAVNLFHATEGRYPKDYEEFMTRIIKENNMKLPNLPKGLKYEYDEVNHKLVVIRADNGKRLE